MGSEKTQFKKGQVPNPGGRPKGTDYTKQLRDAIRHVEGQRVKDPVTGKMVKRNKLLVEFIEKAYTDSRLMVALIKKILPDLKSTENKISVDNIEEITVKFIGDKDES